MKGKERRKEELDKARRNEGGKQEKQELWEAMNERRKNG